MITIMSCHFSCLFLLVFISLSFELQKTAVATAEEAPSTTKTKVSSLPSSIYRNQEQHQQHHRIAILIPFLSKSQPILPSYFTVFLQSVASLSPLIDFFIFHNGQLSSLIVSNSHSNNYNDNSSSSAQSWIMDLPIPSNVKFIDLHNMTHFTSYFLQIMNVKISDQNNKKKNKGIKNHNNNPNSNNEGKEQYHLINKYYAEFLSNNPYLLIELKPALGYIFQQYINKPIDDHHYRYYHDNNTNYYYYTHWGYSDLDIYFGDLLSWITKDELNNFDIVTYGFGDQERVYLRGQFTFHKNDVPLLVHNNTHTATSTVGPLLEEDSKIKLSSKQIHMLWAQCDYLYHFDDRLMKLIKEHQFQIQSAEGCYSSVVISSSKVKKLKVKYAVKAWTNPKDNYDMNEFGVSTIFVKNHNHNVTDGGDDYYNHNMRNVLLKKVNAASGSAFLHSLSKVNSTSILSSSNDLPLQMQWEVGNKTLIKTSDKKGVNCMTWTPKQYQYNLCIDIDVNNVTDHHTIFLIDGKLYKQSFEEIGGLFFLSSSTDNNNKNRMEHEYNDQHIIESKPLFHIQEWKRNYRTSQLLPLKTPKEYIIGWSFFPEGVVPLFDQLQWQQQQKHINHNTIGRNNHLLRREEKYILPSQHYCLQLKKENHLGQYKDNCQWAVSWIDKEVYKLISPEWGQSFGDKDVTLVLTLQINTNTIVVSDESMDSVHHDIDHQKLKSLLRVLEANLSTWKNQSFIVVICITGHASDDIFVEISKWMNRYISSIGPTRYLIGIIKKNITQSSNMNERDYNKVTSMSRNALVNMAESASFTRWTISGLDIESKGTILSADAAYYAQRTASVFGEQYGYIFIIPEFHVSESPTAMSLTSLLEKKKKNLIRSSFMTTSNNSSNQSKKGITLNHIQDQVHSLWWKYMESSRVSLHPTNETLKRDVLALTKNLQSELTQVSLKENLDVLKHSSKFIVMVDRYGRKKGMCTRHLITEIEDLCSCMNMMFRLAQFSLLNYFVLSLPFVFALSSSLSTQSTLDCKIEECDEMSTILTEEKRRLAKTIIMNGI